MNRERILIVDLVRSLAILTVMAFHLKPTLPLPEPIFRWGWDHFQRNGPYGVCIFFVVSGFLITRILDQSPGGLFRFSIKDFYIKRAARILPVFLLSIFLGLLLYVGFSDGSKKFLYCFKLPENPFDPSFWVPLFTFTFNWAGGEWGGVGIHWVIFWSLAIEEQFYLFYPWALRWLAGYRRTLCFLVAVVGAGFCWRWYACLTGPDNIAYSMRSTLGAFDQIAMGAILYLIHRMGPRWVKGRMARSLLIGLGALLVIGTYLFTFPVGEKWSRVYGTTLIALGTASFLLGCLNTKIPKIGSLSWMAFPGKYSYENYLFHASALFFLHPVLWGMNIVVAFVVFAAVTTAFSWLIYRTFEAPLNPVVRTWLCHGARR